MNKTNKILLLAFIIIVIIIISIVIRSRNTKVSNSQTPNKSLTQESEGGNVKIIVTPKTLAVGEKPNFNIVFETHSVDLAFDVTQTSSLIDEKGKVFNQSIWEGTGPGGHHRDGTLTFNTILSETKFIELIIKNVAGVSQRKLRWEL